MFEKTIEKLVLKQLPGIEARLHAALEKSVTETFAKLSAQFSSEIFERISRVENEIKTFDQRLSAEQEGYTTLGKKVDGMKEVLDALPDADDIVTESCFAHICDNNDVLRDEGEFVKKDDFDPSDYDLVTNDDLPDVDDIKTEVTSAIVEKLKEALDGLTV
jgi:hypothetical protein